MNRKYAWVLLVIAGLAACPGSGAAEGKKIDLGAEKPPALAPATEKALSDFRTSIADMVDKIIPVVVSIQTESHANIQALDSDPFEEFFGPGYGGGGRGPAQRRRPRERRRTHQYSDGKAHGD